MSRFRCVLSLTFHEKGSFETNLFSSDSFSRSSKKDFTQLCVEETSLPMNALCRRIIRVLLINFSFLNFHFSFQSLNFKCFSNVFQQSVLKSFSNFEHSNFEMISI